MLFFKTFSFVLFIYFFYDTSFFVIRLHFPVSIPSFFASSSRVSLARILSASLFLFVKRDVIVTDPAINFRHFYKFLGFFFLFKNLLHAIIII